MCIKSVITFSLVRIDGESVKAFDSSLDTCEKVLNEIDDELMEKFSYVGSTINEIKKQLDDIQVRICNWLNRSSCHFCFLILFLTGLYSALILSFSHVGSQAFSIPEVNIHT